ncbi:MAG: MFS transporter [Candidatus Lokiarchaeota archaeon]|nr:MFS transporter [Candidatus Lokiarchaeota archaeon]
MSESKFRVGQTFTIGLAFFSSEIAWALYNAQVPLLLGNYVSSLFIIGLFMALDNILGIIIQPIMGSISDNTRSKFGRRMPYLIVGIPLGAIFFSLIPTENALPVLLLYMFFFGLSMGFYRSQAVSMMPDFVKPANRSKGNAIINLMGGFGVAIGYGFSIFVDTIGLQTLFLIISLIMVIALLVLLWRIKEKESYSYQMILELEGKEGEKVKTEKTTPGLIESVKDIIGEKDKSTLLILFAIFCWFIGYQGIVALISIYGVQVLGYSSGLAGFLPFLVTVPLLISIYPLSYLPAKIGRRNTIKIGVVLWTVMLIIGFFFGLMQVPLYIMAIPLAFLGIGWAMINTNSIVIVWELAPTEKKIGTYTGLYYFFSYFAAILGPMFVGGLTDLFGIASLLLNGAIFFILAFVIMLFVKRGEVELTEEEKLSRQKAIQELSKE